MANLTTSLDHVKNAIVGLRDQLAALNPNSKMHDELLDEFYDLIKRRKMLENYDSERTAQIDVINKDIDERLKKVTEELEGERKERVANINFDYENKIKQLPKLSCPIESYCSTNVETAKLVVRHMQRYTIDFENVPEERNFFHAAACSNWDKYVTEFDGKIDNLNNILWSAANLPNDTKYPLTLADVDRIIHLPSYNEDILVVLDTSLRVILTNAGYSKEQRCPELVVYDSITHKFAPISRENRNKKSFCPKCFRYNEQYPCSCQGRLCPICLRTGDDFKCSKPSSESKSRICPKCNAHCYTDDCFQTHQKVCPRPVSGLHDDIVELLRSIAV